MLNRFLLALLVLCLVVGCLAGCQPSDDPSATESSAAAQVVDYAASVKLNMSSPTLKQEVTVLNYVDGDTVHFNVPKSVMPNGILKARFLAINTPESTGKIEPYGKTASKFTKEKLQKATSIVIESDTAAWNADSTGGRYLVWVWYKTAEDQEYRNLNIEILQEGLAIASNSSQNIYGSVCMSAIEQARNQKLYVYSGKEDPNFYYGEAVELTLKELRTNISHYSDMLVAFNGIIANDSNGSVYVEEYDAATDMYYGISVYYQTAGLSGAGLDILTTGNEVRIVGKVQYYETGESWQISGLQYRAMKPDDPKNIQLISSGHTGSYRLTDPQKFVNGKLDILVTDPETNAESTKTFSYAEMALGTSVTMKDLVVKKVYTTNNGGASDGAMTLTCQVGGVTIAVRTGVLVKDGELITQEAYLNKTIDVKGIVEYFGGDYQIKVFSADDITVH